jgi:AcrR family transcriptional regulator
LATRAPHRIRGLDAEQRRSRRRAQLLDSALELFAQRGYWEISVEQICQQAYVSTKSFYELFPNKEACFLQVRRLAAQKLDPQPSASKHAATATEVDAVATLVDSLVHALVEDQQLLQILFGGPGRVSALDERYRRVLRHRAANMIESLWIQFGVVGDRHRPSPTPMPRPDPHTVAMALVSAISDLISEWAVLADPNDQDDVDALIVQIHLLYDVVRAGLASRLPPVTPRRPGPQLRVAGGAAMRVSGQDRYR